MTLHAASRKRNANAQEVVPINRDTRATVLPILALLALVAVVAWFAVPALPSSVYVAVFFLGSIGWLLHQTRGGAR